ncbi:MAG: hypothetical protein IJ468_04575 [Lachnospiraceae bacterium]|nr:hypothetical protein [Lachnospiraceae bacterium]
MKCWGMIKMDLYRCFAAKRIWLILVLVPILMCGCIHDSILACMKYNLDPYVSGPSKLMEVLYFDRFKAVMVVMLSGIYTFGISDDLQYSFQKQILGRGVSVESYVVSKLIANAIAILFVTISGFLLFLAIISPYFPLRGGAGWNGSWTGFYSVIEKGPFPWLYGVLTGFQFGLAIVFLSNIGIFVSIFAPSRYVAIAIPYILFYILYAFTGILPMSLDFWSISSCWIVLGTNDFWPNFIYSNGILIAAQMVTAAGCLWAMNRRKKNGNL